MFSGWHNRLRNRTRGAGLSFYLLVPVLRAEAEAETAARDIRLVRDEGVGRDQRAAYRRNEERIQEIWDKYTSGEYSTGKMLRACSHVMEPMD